MLLSAAGTASELWAIAIVMQSLDLLLKRFLCPVTVDCCAILQAEQALCCRCGKLRSPQALSSKVQQKHPLHAILRQEWVKPAL